EVTGVSMVRCACRRGSTHSRHDPDRPFPGASRVRAAKPHPAGGANPAGRTHAAGGGTWTTRTRLKTLTHPAPALTLRRERGRVRAGAVALPRTIKVRAACL